MVAAGFALYDLLPDVLGRRSPDSLRRGAPGAGWVGLSFDDGPHPELTPRVLDALAAARARATFFMVGRNARRQPELVRRVVTEGHLLGVHTETHRHAWISGPRRIRAEIEEGLRTLEAVGGVRPVWFRPPWGAFNALTRPTAARLGLRVALWSCDAGDWLPGATPEAILRRVRRGLQPGAIIDLHDGGQTPQGCRAMVEALPAILEAVAAAGLRAGHLGEVIGPPV